MPGFSSRRIEQLKESITTIVDSMLDRIEADGPAFDGMTDYGAHLVVDALLDAMVSMDERRKAIFVAFHDLIPGTTYVKPGAPWPSELLRAFDRTMEEIKVIIDERRVSARPDLFSASAARRCRPLAAPPAGRCICFTRTTTSGTS
jgi:cytochrome P450